MTYCITDGIKPGETVKYGDKVREERVNKEMIKEHVSGDKLRILICGTRAFDTDMMTLAKDFGLSEKNIHKF